MLQWLTFTDKPNSRTSVDEEQHGELPTQFELGQNYPNPFNPTTNFGFRIAEFGLVKLRIYDPLGREIATLVNSELQPGEHNVQWDATGFPSGVYFYRLTANSFVETKKLILLK